MDIERSVKRKEGHLLHLQGGACGWDFDPRQLFEDNQWEGIPVQFDERIPNVEVRPPHTIEECRAGVYVHLRLYRAGLEKEGVTPEGIAFVTPGKRPTITVTAEGNAFVTRDDGFLFFMWGNKEIKPVYSGSVNEPPTNAIDRVPDGEKPAVPQSAVG